jgi:diguanylate cyclase (GGDEF)-like protein/PAS domain S-box-containing protein
MTRALVVDDLEENLYMLRALLQGHGLEVITAHNGAEALSAARQQAPDIVISDLLMPVMDGYTLLRDWKSDPSLTHIPFIVYTATYTEPKDERLALDLGADAFMVKPAEPDVFMERLHEVLAKAQGGALPLGTPVLDEATALKHHSEVLVRKLAQRSEQLAQRVQELAASEQNVRRLNLLYRVLSETNQAIVHLVGEDELFRTICRTAVERGGFAMAWVGLIEQAQGRITPVAWSGSAEDWLDTIRTPVELAVSENRVYLSNDLASDARLQAIHGSLHQAGLNSAISVPLRIGDKMVGALTLFAVEKDYFDEAMLELVVEMASNISFALDNVEKERKRRLAEERLQQSEDANRLTSSAVEASANGIMITAITPDGNPIHYVNPAFEHITGYSRSEVIGRDPRFLRGSDLEQFGTSDINAALRNTSEGKAVLRNYRKDGSLFWNELSIAPVVDASGRATHFVGIINDITEQKRYEAQLERQNNQDDLTGLASRNLLRDRTGQAIAHALHHKHFVALLFIDLDDFKRINDSLGHGVGDTILCVIAERIKGCIRERDTLARLGGDEFVLVLSDMAGLQDASLMASQVLQAIAQPISAGGREIDLSGSIGISVFPADGEDYDTLLRNADAAMYKAKQTSGKAFCFYTGDMNVEAMRRLELESGLRQALGQNKLTLHYQPLLDLRSGQVVGAEALLRWRGQDDVLVSPAEFIPVAEQTGLIVPIGEWVLHTACAQAQRWLQEGIELCVSVNLSTRQLRDRNLADTVRRCLAEHRLPAHLLKLEITESAVMEDAEAAASILGELKQLGVLISVDDFGTGYSSLAYLRRFPIDQIKIDRSFIVDMADNADAAAMVESIIGLARKLRLQTVAEGVETEVQQAFIKRAGCDLLQGFLFSRPLPPESIPALLRKVTPHAVIPLSTERSEP